MMSRLDDIINEKKGMENYKVTFIDNDIEGIIIPATNLKELFIKLQRAMSELCYYEDDIISIKKGEE